MFMNWKLHKDKLTSFPIFWPVRIDTWLSKLSLPLQKLLKLALTCTHLLFQYCQQLLVVVSVSLLPDVLVWLHTCNVLFLDYNIILKDPGGLTDYIATEYIPDFLGGPYEVSKAMRYSVKLPWTVTRISKQCLLHLHILKLYHCLFCLSQITSFSALCTVYIKHCPSLARHRNCLTPSDHRSDHIVEQWFETL